MIVYTLKPKGCASLPGGDFPILDGFLTLSENLADRWLGSGGKVTVTSATGVDVETVRSVLAADAPGGSTYAMVEAAEDQA
jgi:hypothetical protein